MKDTCCGSVRCQLFDWTFWITETSAESHNWVKCSTLTPSLSIYNWTYCLNEHLKAKFWNTFWYFFLISKYHFKLGRRFQKMFVTIYHLVWSIKPPERNFNFAVIVAACVGKSGAAYCRKDLVKHEHLFWKRVKAAPLIYTSSEINNEYWNYLLKKISFCFQRQKIREQWIDHVGNSKSSHPVCVL